MALPIEGHTFCHIKSMLIFSIETSWFLFDSSWTLLIRLAHPRSHSIIRYSWFFFLSKKFLGSGDIFIYLNVYIHMHIYIYVNTYIYTYDDDFSGFNKIPDDGNPFSKSLTLESSCPESLPQVLSIRSLLTLSWSFWHERNLGGNALMVLYQRCLYLAPLHWVWFLD